ncbi:hypothetical protein AAH995_23115, partial [Pseudomonas putida]|uniref:hypothetical protein n=1 Tax=Pseudomonas putida TaxID=303 RepID=UPI00349E6362
MKTSKKASRRQGRPRVGLRENDLAVGKLVITPFDACLGGFHLNAVIVVNNDDLVRIQHLYTAVSVTKCNTRGKVLHDYSLHPLDHR